MGDIAPSKMPKARTVKKKDGNEPVKVFKGGGKVRRFKEGGLEEDMAQDIAKRQKREDSSGLRFEGGGGKNEYATSMGGRLSYDIPAGEDATISPYIEGFVAKPKDRKLMGEVTTPSRDSVSASSKVLRRLRFKALEQGNGVREKPS
jgi:hypothetical protein